MISIGISRNLMVIKQLKKKKKQDSTGPNILVVNKLAIQFVVFLP